NADTILDYLAEASTVDLAIDSFDLCAMVRLAVANEDVLTTEHCINHGDLNFANIICDEGDNTWFIDWTHCGHAPAQLDFAKLENDVKFVMSKDFELEDLPRLQRFEEYLLTTHMPASVTRLPDSLRFARWDLRFRRLLGAVRRIRGACFALKDDTDAWLVYRIALLRYATHTLSFDARRGRGECGVTELGYALLSVDLLATGLVADDYHLRIRAERPADYPERLRISIDQAPWSLPCPDYEPPYYVAPAVLAADGSKADGSWADSEDTSLLVTPLHERPAKRRDSAGRPLNPRGRTGIAGRGQLGHWGANRAVAATVFRLDASLQRVDLLICHRVADGPMELPQGFVLSAEREIDGLTRVLSAEVHPDVAAFTAASLTGGYTYDKRQTDHAWVETQGYGVFASNDDVPDIFSPTREFDEIAWFPLTAETINSLPSAHAKVARDALVVAAQAGHVERKLVDRLIALTG
ncbi:MAG: phosphotransferase, partial [Myxococcales bacterium]|nr:phosphotransferase [Myxococcales bacterium]